MAKIGSIVKRTATPTSIDGLYIRNISYKDLQAYQERVAELAEDRPGPIVFEAFQTLLCDEHGEEFEDVNSVDEVENNFGMMQLREIMESVGEALAPGK